jgi:hypothetical protein
VTEGSASADTCAPCSIGKYSSTNGSVACDPCPKNEITAEAGSFSAASCVCLQGYTRDCRTNACTACDSGQLFWGGACEKCPESGICDGSSEMICSAGTYLHAGGISRPVCHPCPAGADCTSAPGTFLPLVAESKWEAGEDGLRRVVFCPPGYALARTPLYPQADECELCPRGSYNLDGSVYDSSSLQSGTRSPPFGFCLSCPRAGAVCPGGSRVEAQEGYYTFAITPEGALGDGRRQEASPRMSNISIVQAYQCPLEACAGNNTCKGDRTG